VQVASRPISSVPDTGVVGGGRGVGMASYQPTQPVAAPMSPPEVTGSTPQRRAGRRNADGGTVVIVAPGETVYSIARRHGIAPGAILQANNLTMSSVVRPGQRLVVPRAGDTPVSAPTLQAAHSTPVASTRPTATGSSGVHVVAPGENLYRISRRYRVSVADVASANNMQPSATLKIGDRITIPGHATSVASRNTPKAGRPLASSPKSTSAKAAPAKETPAPKQPDQPEHAAVVTPSNEQPERPTHKANDATPSFRWPVKGRVIVGYGPNPNGQQNDGINLAVPEGTPVKAAEDGVVAYAGNELKGYGNLVLIPHSNGYVTAYAHAKELMVKRGDPVKRGQVIANAGQTGNVDAPQLHFEVRKGPSPLDPMPLLTGG
jgi:murein DD-endopeptidase MepM/ murein hydrolase activator NlpD